MQGKMTEGLIYNATDSKTFHTELGHSYVQLGVHAAMEMNRSCLITPTTKEFYAGLSPVTTTVVFTLAGVAVLFTLLLYSDTLQHILRHTQGRVKSDTVFIVSIYPFVAIATLLAIAIPRAQLILEAGIQVFLLTCLYKLFCLIINYGGGETELMKKTGAESPVQFQVGPCCCWPCCSFFPKSPLTKGKLLLVRLMVLQMPLIQGALYVVFLIMWAENELIYQKNYGYLQPVVVASIFFGLWGMAITHRTVDEHLAGFHITGKVKVLQFVLLVTKLENFLTRIIIKAHVFPCQFPITPSIFGNLIYNSIVLWEIALLAVFARILYKRKVPFIGVSNLPDKIDPKSITELDSDKCYVVRF